MPEATLDHTVAVHELHELLSAMGVADARVEPSPFAGHTMLSVSASVDLVGPQGEHLQALNHIFRKLMERKYDREAGKGYLVDAREHQRKRFEELLGSAKMLAERVRSLKSRAELSPMNAFERMIVHAAFTDDPEVTTVSEGEGKERRVVLMHRG